MRTALALTVVLAVSGCANKKTAIGLGAASAAGFAYAAYSMSTGGPYCNNAFGGEWGVMHECNTDAIAGFSAGIIFGLAAAVTWAQANQPYESNAALDEKGRMQRIHILGIQAHDAAVIGDCPKARTFSDRIAAIDPTAVRTLVLSDAAVRACLAPATNPTP
jgi:hypothetical protein